MNRFGRRQAQLLQELAAKKSRPRRAAGRKPTIDYEQADIETIRRRIWALRDTRRIKTVATLQSHRRELRKLERLLKKRLTKKAASKRGHRRERAKNAQLANAERRRLQRVAHTKAKALQDWRNYDWRQASRGRRFDELRPRELYRWHHSIGQYVRVPEYLIQLAGVQEGDIRRVPFHLKDGLIYRGGTWVDASNYDIKQAIKDRMPPIPPVVPTPTPAPVVPMFDSTGLPKPDDVDCWHFNRGDDSLENWRRKNWPKYGEWLDAQAKPKLTPVPVAPMPVIPMPVIVPEPPEPRLRIAPIEVTTEMIDIIIKAKPVLDVIKNSASAARRSTQNPEEQERV